MGGWNQSQAHTQFVVDIADFGMNPPAGARGGPLHQGHFEGCDVEIENSVPQQPGRARFAGHQLQVQPHRTPNFGYGQAVLYDRKTSVKLGASDPRHDGQAIPVPAPYFAK